MRFHVLALPHTQTTLAHCCCAFTQKVRNFCRMMLSLGHEVYHYGAEGSDTDICTEHVTCISRQDQSSLFGDYDFRKTFYSISWDEKLAYWQLFNSNCIKEIQKRRQARDFLCPISGPAQYPVARALPDLINVEYGIGYTGIAAKHRIFESYALMHQVLGHDNWSPNGFWSDAVIPNYFDPDMFPFCEKADEENPYLLFVGRLIQRKGIQIAAGISRMSGIPLLVAGQGCAHHRPGRIVTEDNTVLEAPGLTYIGTLDVEKRAQVMGKATAALVPTIYVEPFGGVSVEVQLCGTPCLAANYGGMTETIEHGVTGFRCHTYPQYVAAIEKCKKLDRKAIRERAIQKYSIWNVRHQFNEYFEMLADEYAPRVPSRRRLPRGIKPPLRIVTAAMLGLRDDREDKYYLEPLTALTRRLEGVPDVQLDIYSNAPDRIVVPACGEVIYEQPEPLAREFWQIPDIAEEYAILLRRNMHVHGWAQQKFPRLIVTWLAKFAMMQRAFADSSTEAVLWIDAGLWNSLENNHDCSKFHPSCMADLFPPGISRKLVNLAQTQHANFVTSEKLPMLHMPWEWFAHYVDGIEVCWAAIMLVHRDTFTQFWDSSQKWWLRLVADGKAGTEENAISIACAEHKWARLTYEKWKQVLKGISP